MKAMVSRRASARQLVWAAAALLGALAIAACGDSAGGDGDQAGVEGGKGGGGSLFKAAIIEVDPSKPITVSQTVGVGQESEYPVRIINTGAATLDITGITLAYAGSEDPPAFRLEKIRGLCKAEEKCAPQSYSLATDKLPVLRVRSSAQGTGVEAFDSLEAVVVFRRPDDSKPRSADMTITSNADGATTKIVSFATQTGLPKITIFPKEVDFKQVGSGQEAEKAITVTNVGSEPLIVDRLDFTGNDYFTLSIDEDGKSETAPVDHQPGGQIKLDPPLSIAAGEINTIKVKFSPETADAATATVVVYSNDADVPAGVEVLIKGNTEGPCLKVNPATVNFGAKGVGMLSVLPLELTSCGTSPVEIYSIVLDPERTSLDFALDLTPLPGLETGGEVTQETPLVIPINESVELNVRFVPDTENPKDEANQPIPDLGYIMIANNTFDENLEVKVQGIGVDIDCPQAVIQVDEGEEVIPQTVLHLKGDQSFSPSGPIAKWEWSVQQPIGSQSLFNPSATFPNPTFEANVAGSYLFKLTVWDENGTPSCVPAEAQVVVIPDEAIHVEILWNTPNDPDQTDEGPEAGADVDLHFLHPYASGPDLDGDGKPDGWFDQPFDSFWFNPAPNWGSIDPAVDDDPGLDRDDTDGAGPENLNLNIPENDKTYRVGVHYWHDHKYGPSYVTVRVYIYALLSFELTDVKLLNHDMWEVCTIDWPSGTVSLITDQNTNYKITPNYENPFFFQP